MTFVKVEDAHISCFPPHPLVLASLRAMENMHSFQKFTLLLRTECYVYLEAYPANVSIRTSGR